MSDLVTTQMTEEEFIAAIEQFFAGNSEMTAFFEGFFAILFTALTAILVCSAICLLLRIVAYWRIYDKAGDCGWKSLIPFYSKFTRYKLTWTPWMYLLYLTLGFVALALQSPELSTVCTILTVLQSIIGAVAFYKLSRSFGHGIGFTVGLVLLRTIFLLVLAFGSLSYLGDLIREVRKDL